jgi:hypothetical protein
MNTTTNPNGSTTVSAIVDGYLVHRTYYGYTRRQALAAFRASIGYVG